MTEKKKTGHLKPETKEKLQLSLEMASSDAVDLITEAYGQDLFTKQGRGDKVWLYKGAKEALSCMEKIKRILNDDELTAGNTDERSITPEQQAAKLLESVAKKLEERRGQRPERPS
ncbi:MULTISPECIES: hypothetical protein [Acinetobacter]|uniref:hypothetical protein n=1 Tax=Acinetobacter TaxID=469 RepID=UPI0012E29AF8|nr:MULTISPECIES: hypothetical protein [Acinetobacter]MCA4232784.1 hypothetical protein [Acinetobacter baumannii]MDM1330004.1 hypothetical protein [Acinetobacter indicus]